MMNEIISYGRLGNHTSGPSKIAGIGITYVAKGALDWMVDGTPIIIPQGAIFFTLPWQENGSMNLREPDNNEIYQVLFNLKEDNKNKQNQIEFPDSLRFSTAEMSSISSTLCDADKNCFTSTPSMRWLMPNLVSELNSNNKLSSAHIQTLMRGILVELTRIVSGDSRDTTTYTHTEQRVQSLIEELPNRLDQQWHLKDMASYCRMRCTQLNVIFQKLTGNTPMDHLSRLRIDRSRTLLRDTEMKVIDIAFACGFSSSQYFANSFRRATGLSPSNYRDRFSELFSEQKTEQNSFTCQDEYMPNNRQYAVA